MLLCYVPGTVLGTGNTRVKKTSKMTKFSQDFQQVINKYGVSQMVVSSNKKNKAR